MQTVSVLCLCGTSSWSDVGGRMLELCLMHGAVVSNVDVVVDQLLERGAVLLHDGWRGDV